MALWFRTWIGQISGIAALTLLGGAGACHAVASGQGGIQAGAAVVERYGCRVCHRIGERGGRVGPDLNQVTQRRSEAWLMKWLADPPATRPGTVMPKYSWAAGEREALIVYLRQFAVPVDGAAIVARLGPGQRAGEQLVKAYQCGACHKVGGEEGRAGYPNLNTVRKRRSAEWERRWLENPQAEMPGAFMPDFRLTPPEIQAIVAYLYR